MRVLLITQTFKVMKAHDLSEFYWLLLEDCQNRLITGFVEVANILEKHNLAFGGVRKDGSPHAGYCVCTSEGSLEIVGHEIAIPRDTITQQ